MVAVGGFSAQDDVFRLQDPAERLSAGCVFSQGVNPVCTVVTRLKRLHEPESDTDCIAKFTQHNSGQNVHYTISQPEELVATCKASLAGGDQGLGRAGI